jgi:hypothetical protein
VRPGSPTGPKLALAFFVFTPLWVALVFAAGFVDDSRPRGLLLVLVGLPPALAGGWLVFHPGPIPWPGANNAFWGAVLAAMICLLGVIAVAAGVDLVADPD